MPLEKILHKLQMEIDELTPTLESFMDSTIQPTVSDCEKLQAQLSRIQEQLAVYKFNKSNKELSPMFNIHSRVSEAEFIQEKNTEPPPKKDKTPEPPQKIQANQPVSETKKTDPVSPRKTVTVGLNDKFRFINELFAQNNSEYNIVIEQINNLTSWQETEIYLNSLKSVYNWKENQEVVRYFYSIVKNRFD